MKLSKLLGWVQHFNFFKHGPWAFRVSEWKKLNEKFRENAYVQFISVENRRWKAIWNYGIFDWISTARSRIRVYYRNRKNLLRISFIHRGIGLKKKKKFSTHFPLLPKCYLLFPRRLRKIKFRLNFDFIFVEIFVKRNPIFFYRPIIFRGDCTDGVYRFFREPANVMYCIRDSH